MKRSETINKICSALSKAQGEFTNPKKTKTNPYYNSKYADMADILDAIRPVLLKNELSIIQDTENGDLDRVIITTTLMHSSGEYFESGALTLKPDKITAQGVGAAITYGRRYSISSILNIASEDDDDGNPPIINKNVKSNGGINRTPKTNFSLISPQQLKRMYTVASDNKMSKEDAKKIIIKYGYESSKEIEKKNYDKIINEIEFSGLNNKPELECTEDSQKHLKNI